MRTNRDNVTVAQNTFLYFFNRNSKFKNKQNKREPFLIKASLASLASSFLTNRERPEMPSTGLITDPHTYSQVIILLSLDLTIIFLYSAAAQYTSF